LLEPTVDAEAALLRLHLCHFAKFELKINLFQEHLGIFFYDPEKFFFFEPQEIARNRKKSQEIARNRQVETQIVVTPFSLGG
jgi:hypothetical protein